MEIQEPAAVVKTDPEIVMRAIQKMERKYFDLVWYARSNPEMYRRQGTPEHIIEGALNAMAKKEEMYPDEIDAYRENPDWTHGFNSGMLAALRYVMTAMETQIFDDEDEPGETFAYGGLEDAEEDFPMLDT